MNYWANLNSFGFALRAGILLIFFAAMFPAWGESVRLHLRNGDRLTGTILSETSEEISFATRAVGTVRVSTAEVERREFIAPIPEAAPAPAPDLMPPADAEAAPAEAEEQREPMAHPAPIAVLPPEPSRVWTFLGGWKGELRLGANLGFSAKNRQTYTGALKATHTHGSMKNILENDATYGRSEGVLSDNRMDGSWKLEYDLGERKRFHVYNATGAGYDTVRGIRLRYDFGPGVGYKWLVRTNHVLKTEIGGNFQEQQFEDRTRKRRFSVRFAEEFWWQVTPKVRFEEKLEFFPQVEDFGEFRIRAEVKLSYLLRENLSVALSVINLYDTDVPQNVTRNDLQIRGLVGLKF
jgi:putative salt-induced outer membrane protein YdiY